MIRIGLIGEDPNDTVAIANLLMQRYGSKVKFVVLARGLRGNQLDTRKLKKLLPLEFEDRKCDCVIFIRDLDGFKNSQPKSTLLITWFKELCDSINGKGIFLLNIWEIEGLIFADIDTFNQIYKTTHKFKGDCSTLKEPKEALKHITSKTKRKYEESHCPEIFKKLDINVLEKNCTYFNFFLSSLNTHLR